VNIQKIYNRYRIPEGLQQHMRWVAQVADQVVENWIGSNINADLVQQTALLHDMGNIIKFKRPFWGEMAKSEYFWMQTQEEFIAQYGSDVLLATRKIIDELGLKNSVGRMVAEMGIITTNPNADVSYEARIVEYADCRVSLKGIVSFADRVADLMARYDLVDDDIRVKAMRENAKLVLQFVKKSQDQSNLLRE